MDRRGQSVWMKMAGACVGAALCCPVAYSADLSQPGAIDREQKIQHEMQQKLQRQLSPAADDVRLLSPEDGAGVEYPQETPCFVINQILLENGELFRPVALRSLVASALGKCLGGQGIGNLMSAIQNSLIDDGYVTTRLLAPSQDLNSGILRLIIVPGRVGSVRLSETSSGSVRLSTTLPLRRGDLLDLRDIEQGLENLQRFSTVAANFQIVPGAQPGESDVVVDWQQEKYWRAALTLDDSGSENTGKMQANVSLFLDNPLRLSDQLYLSVGRSVFAKSGQGTENWAFGYSIPFGYWMFGVTGSDNYYYQTVAGIGTNYEYSGTSRDFAVQIRRVLQRTARSKTALSLQVSKRESQNFIEDVEVEVQRRKTAAWELSLSHRHFIGDSTLDASLTYRQGERWFDSIPAPEESAGVGTALPKIWRARIDLEVPFEAGGQRFRYSGTVKGQWADTMLTPFDRFSIGNRWSVRGFDGQWTLAADHGWYISNEVSWKAPRKPFELYLGLDYGEVSGGGEEFLLGTRLAGAVIGLRGDWKDLNYHLFVGAPVKKPRGFVTDHVTAGFDLSWQF